MPIRIINGNNVCCISEEDLRSKPQKGFWTAVSDRLFSETLPTLVNVGMLGVGIGVVSILTGVCVANIGSFMMDVLTIKAERTANFIRSLDVDFAQVERACLVVSNTSTNAILDAAKIGESVLESAVTGATKIGDSALESAVIDVVTSTLK